jgi:hypothetical protein
MRDRRQRAGAGGTEKAQRQRKRHGRGAARFAERKAKGREGRIPGKTKPWGTGAPQQSTLEYHAISPARGCRRGLGGRHDKVDSRNGHAKQTKKHLNMIEEAKVELRLGNGKIKFNNSTNFVFKHRNTMILMSEKDRNYKSILYLLE